MNRKTIYRIICVCIILTGAIVIQYPHLFYFGESPIDKAIDNGVVTRDAQRKNDVDMSIESIMNALDRNNKDIHKYNKRMPYFGQGKPSDVHALDAAKRRQHELAIELQQLKEEKELILSTERSVSPVFSRLCFDESRALWWKRQKYHGSVSVDIWKWDMIFSTIFQGADRDDGPLMLIVMAVLKLLWRLTFGAILAFFDFAIRLPFYLREYDMYDYDDSAQIKVAQIDQNNINNNNNNNNNNINNNNVNIKTADLSKGKIRTSVSMSDDSLLEVRNTPLDLEVGRIDRDESVNGWFSMRSLSMISVYTLLTSGALVGTLSIILVIWSPVILLCAYGIYRKRHERNNHQQYQQQYHPHYD